jgi:hypothetical protein
MVKHIGALLLVQVLLPPMAGAGESTYGSSRVCAMRLRGGASLPDQATGCVSVDGEDCCVPRPEYQGQKRKMIWKERPVPNWAKGKPGEPVCARILDLRAGPGEEHLLCKPRGRAVVFDPKKVTLAPLWSEDILDADFPRWQDGSNIDQKEYERCGAAGYPFHAWLRKLLPSDSQVWQPPKLPTKGGVGESGGQKGLRIGGLFGRAPRREGRPEVERERFPEGKGRRGDAAVTSDATTRNEAETLEDANATLVLACNSLQSNFMAPYDFVVADGRVVRQRYSVAERPLTGTSCWVFQTSGSGPPRVVRVQVGDDDQLWHQAEPSYEQAWSDVSLKSGISGLPILLNGVNVCSAINQRIPGTPMYPNTVTWNPATTRAAFSAIGSIGAAKSFIICISVTEELNVTEFAECVRTLGVQDALLLGGSGDVNLWVRPDAGEGQTAEGEEKEGGAVRVTEGDILMAAPRAGGTRVALGPGERPLNALVAAYLMPGS